MGKMIRKYESLYNGFPSKDNKVQNLKPKKLKITSCIWKLRIKLSISHGFYNYKITHFK